MGLLLAADARSKLLLREPRWRLEFLNMFMVVAKDLCVTLSSSCISSASLCFGAEGCRLHLVSWKFLSRPVKGSRFILRRC